MGRQGGVGGVEVTTMRSYRGCLCADGDDLFGLGVLWLLRYMEDDISGPFMSVYDPFL